MRLLLIIACLFCISTLHAQQVNEPKALSADWDQPYQPFRVAGNLYYVGTYDLACYLITTSQGNILINTGLAASASIIEANINTLGFKLSDTKILLTTQAHYDHLGAMATIKQKTGAQMVANEKDATVIADGGASDYAFGGNGPTFAPIPVDRILRDGDVVRLGDMEVTILHHPGHTKGSSSYLFTVKDEKQSYKVLIANMPSIVINSFGLATSYPTISADYAYTLEKMKGLQFDLWLASHASQFGMHNKRKQGDAYNPKAFADKEGYLASLARLQKAYDEKK